MQPNYLNLVKVFGSEIRHTVPLFQRPYVWSEEENWRPLWEDISYLLDRVETAGSDTAVAGHFLGTVVLEQTPHRTGTIARREVIDGQQRLTTLQLLLKATEHALAETAATAQKDDDEPRAKAAQIAARQIAALTANPAYAEDDEKYKVWPTNEDRAAFKAVMDANSAAELSEAASRMADAYHFFLASIRPWLSYAGGTARATTLASALKDHLRLIVLDLDDGDEPQAIFETLNAHGTPLLPADLIKNWLLWEATRQRLPRERIAEIYVSYWQQFDQGADYWREKIGTGHAARARVDTFLQNWLTRRTRELVPAKHLYDRFLQHVAPPRQTNGERSNNCDVVQVISDAHSDAKRYRIIDNPEGSSRFYTLLRRLSTMDIAVFHPALLEVMGREGTDDIERDKFAMVLESYLVRRMVCAQQTRGYATLALGLLEALQTAERSQSIAQTATAFFINASRTLSWPDDELFKREWCSRRFYGGLRRERVLMILQAIEEHYQTTSVKAEPIVQFNFSALQIEHILPQEWEENWPVGENPTLRANREIRLHSVGNLTLVSGRLNPALSNAPWLPAANGQPGKRAALEEHSRLQLNARLVREYATKWDEASIDHRALELFKVAAILWPRPMQ